MKFCSFIFLPTLFVTLSLLTSCGPASKDAQAGKSKKLKYDTSVIAIIPQDTSFRHPFGSNYKAATLTQDEIDEIDRLFKLSIDHYNASIKSSDKEYYEVNLQKTKYRRQYVCVTNRMGEKEVFINCFCMSFSEDWRKYLVIVDDGGSCFFSFKINLNTKQYYDFQVNGYA
jgi:hypothetical protein